MHLLISNSNCQLFQARKQQREYELETLHNSMFGYDLIHDCDHWQCVIIVQDSFLNVHIQCIIYQTVNTSFSWDFFRSLPGMG